MIKSQYLPVATSVWFMFTFVITYIIAVAKKDVYYLFPYISETGSLPPASCVFSQFLNLGALLMLVALYVRYRQVDYDIKTQNIKLSPKWNTVGFKFGVASCLGVSIVGNFQESNVISVHLIGAIMAFGVGSVYFGLQTRISYAYVSARKRSIPKWLFYMRLLLSVPLVPMFLLIFIFGGLAMSEYPDIIGKNRAWWTEDYGGYGFRIASTFTEWILAITIFIYILTFTNEIKCIQFEGFQFKINGEKKVNQNEYNLHN